MGYFFGLNFEAILESKGTHLKGLQVGGVQAVGARAAAIPPKKQNAVGLTLPVLSPAYIAVAGLTVNAGVLEDQGRTRVRRVVLDMTNYQIVAAGLGIIVFVLDGQNAAHRVKNYKIRRVFLDGYAHGNYILAGVAVHAEMLDAKAISYLSNWRTTIPTPQTENVGGEVGQPILLIKYKDAAGARGPAKKGQTAGHRQTKRVAKETLANSSLAGHNYDLMGWENVLDQPRRLGLGAAKQFGYVNPHAVMPRAQPERRSCR